MGERQPWESQLDELSPGDSAASGLGEHCPGARACFSTRDRGSQCLITLPGGIQLFCLFWWKEKSGNFSPPPSDWLGGRLRSLWPLWFKLRGACNASEGGGVSHESQRSTPFPHCKKDLLLLLLQEVGQVREVEESRAGSPALVLSLPQLTVWPWASHSLTLDLTATFPESYGW